MTKAALLLVLCSPPTADVRATLAQGKSVVVDTGPANKVEVDVAATADTVTRVLVSPVDPASGVATLAVTAGGKPVDAAVYTFQGHACVEWPNAAGRTCTVAVAGPAAATKYRVKRADVKPPTMGPGQLTLGAPVAFASAVWFRVGAPKGKLLTFKCSGAQSLTGPTWRILGADAATVRADLKGNPAEWTPAAAEKIWVRTIAASWPAPNVAVTVSTADDGPGPAPAEDIDMELPPEQTPEAGKTVEAVCKLTAGSYTSTSFDLESGVTYVVEVAAGAAKDPVLEVRDGATGGLLAWDDDGGTNGGAKLTLKYPASRSVTLAVRSLDPAGAGKVTIKVGAE